MSILDRAKILCKRLARAFEGLALAVYFCPAKKPTIGYGHVCAPDHPPITAAQAEVYLDADVMVALAGALKYCPGLAKHPAKLGAIADFCFNLGVGRLQTSTLRRRINQGDWEAARRELARWVYGGGRVLPGLVRRRAAEAKLFGE
ncbi:MAG: lysozyme [Syntrophaceae bacterium]|jgi:lysozyme|nr:lysozyme [Syntrophaceae bacterium]